MVDTSAIVVLAMRCFGEGDQLYEHYHDHEWGRPIWEERALLERLCLEGFQSGLSWLTILRKRENFRLAFADFDPEVRDRLIAGAMLPGDFERGIRAERVEHDDVVRPRDGDEAAGDIDLFVESQDEDRNGHKLRRRHRVASCTSLT